MMQAAHGGDAMQTLSRQFGLSPEQTQNAVSALMPAFSMGLQKQTESADALGNLFQSMFAGPYAAAFSSPQKAVEPTTVNAGNMMLNQMFGSQAVTNQVAQHAAAMSGVSSSLLQQMMPVIASMVIGGLLKGTGNNNGLGGILGQMMGGAQGSNIGDILGQMMGQGRQQQPMPQSGSPFPGGLGDILGQMMGQGRPPQSAPAPAPSNNPYPGGFGDILGQIFGGAPSSRQPEPEEEEPEAEPAPQQSSSNPGIDILNSWFKAGTEMQDAHLKGLQDIFDKMNDPTPKR